jgi:DNA polymerase I
MNLVLIDLSSLAHPMFHMSASEPDPNWTSRQVVARIRALASGQPHVAICCDKGKSFRHELTATYKANRPEHEATLHHQIKLAIETLTGDGFPVWAAPGFEADDLIATASRPIRI